MSIVDRLFGSVIPPQNQPHALKDKRTAPQVASLLADAETKLGELQSKRGQVALDATLGQSGSKDALAQWHREVEEQQHVVSDLRAAFAAAQAKDAQAEAARLASTRQTQIRAAKSHLDAATKSLIRVQASIENLAINYEEARKAVAKAKDAAPVEIPWPRGTVIENLEMGLQVELFRAGHGEDIGHLKAFPYALPGSFRPPANYGTPDAIMPLVDRVKADIKSLLDLMTGAAAPKPAPVEAPRWSYGDVPLNEAARALNVKADRVARGVEAFDISPPAAAIADAIASEPVTTPLDRLNGELMGAVLRSGREAADGVLAKFSPSRDVHQIEPSEYGVVIAALHALPPRTDITEEITNG